MITSGQSRGSILDQLDKLMTAVLFANGQNERFQGKFLLNYHTKLNYWTDQLAKDHPYRRILDEIYEILDTWLGGWTYYWQHVSPTLFPYLGEDPEIRAIQTLMK